LRENTISIFRIAAERRIAVYEVYE